MPEVITTQLPDPDAMRAVIILSTAIIPMAIATAQLIARPLSRVDLGALILTTSWNLVFLFAGNQVAVALGWWSFNEAGPELGGIPVVLIFGWAVLWGPVATQLQLRPTLTIALLLGIDLLAMPLLDPVVSLGPSWLVGEAALLAFVAYPGLLGAEWMGNPDRVIAGAWLQVVLFAGILLWAIPLLATAAVGQQLTLDVPTWAYGAVVVVIGVPSLPALIAVRDFAANNGTPWPWDSTDRPVLSGPYRYVRSPMQASGGVLLIAITFLYGQWPIALAAVAAMLFSQVFSLIEHDDLQDRFGSPWVAVTRDQKQWIPNWRPHPAADRATVWINQGCDTCNPIATFLTEQNAINLEIRWAHEHDEALTRIRYERADGTTFDGITAVGACLEHLNLAWAFVGWLLRLPVAWRFWQLIADGVGFAPRPAVDLADNHAVERESRYVRTTLET